MKPTNTAADPETTEKIRAINKAYIEAVLNHDAAAVAALFTEDAVFVTDRGPVYGRAAIKKWYADLYQVWHPTDRLSKPYGNSPDTTGGVAWEAGEWSETGQGETGDPVHLEGYWSALDVREGNDWKIRMLTYNITPAAPPS